VHEQKQDQKQHYDIVQLMHQHQQMNYHKVKSYEYLCREILI
jgi:hypothetical protein